MVETKKMTDSGWLPVFFWQHKWILIVAAIAGGIIAYSATYFSPSKFESTAVVYAAGASQDNQMTMKQGNTMLLLQFLKSSYLKDMVISEYELAAHYGIDTTSGQGITALSNKYDNNISFERTIYKSVRVTVKDNDPEYAAKLANGIVRLSNRVKKHIIKTNKKDNLKAITSNYRTKQREVDSLASEIKSFKRKETKKALSQLQQQKAKEERNIQSLRSDLATIRERFQLHNLNHHIDLTKEALMQAKTRYQYKKGKLETYRKNMPEGDSTRIRTKAEVEGLKNKVAKLSGRLTAYSKAESRYNRLLNELALRINMRDKLAERISEYANSFEPSVESVDMQTRNEKYKSELKHLQRLKSKYEEAQAAFNKPERAAYMVSEAKPDYEPAYPRTWLITGVGAMLTFFITLSVLLILRKASIE
ncbi:MAG: hypothetical protein K9J27_11020 [Bacteroidales bacterium]|nr:hypothetical protein [Bacteroidales bacterium]MCF8338813.1 hypothetical protein [Bacteroidales bacterium]